MDYYANEIERAYKSFLGCLVKQNTIVEAIGKVRGSYGNAIAGIIDNKASQLLLGIGGY